MSYRRKSLLTWTFFSNFQHWRLAILEPLGVKLTFVAHLKALIMLYWNLDRSVARQNSALLSFAQLCSALLSFAQLKPQIIHWRVILLSNNIASDLPHNADVWCEIILLYQVVIGEPPVLSYSIAPDLHHNAGFCCEIILLSGSSEVVHL